MGQDREKQGFTSKKSLPKGPLNATLPRDFLTKVRSVSAHRPKQVIDHILQHGYVTTDELLKLYDYKHAPRARMDVKDAGIPIKTIMISYESEGGRRKRMAAYTFDPEGTVRTERGGRVLISKAFKAALVAEEGSRCNICGVILNAGELQVDHRVPYQISADAPDGEHDHDDFMIACRSCQRAKSWACEHCPNWTTADASICEVCFWARPDKYSHVETRPERRLQLSWVGDEVVHFKTLETAAKRAGKSIAEYLKSLAPRQ